MQRSEYLKRVDGAASIAVLSAGCAVHLQRCNVCFRLGAAGQIIELRQAENDPLQSFGFRGQLQQLRVSLNRGLRRTKPGGKMTHQTSHALLGQLSCPTNRDWPRSLCASKRYAVRQLANGGSPTMHMVKKIFFGIAIIVLALSSEGWAAGEPKYSGFLDD